MKWINNYMIPDLLSYLQKVYIWESRGVNALSRKTFREYGK